jgi:hypothetical protein
MSSIALALALNSSWQLASFASAHAETPVQSQDPSLRSKKSPEVLWIWLRPRAFRASFAAFFDTKDIATQTIGRVLSLREDIQFTDYGFTDLLGE